MTTFAIPGLVVVLGLIAGAALRGPARIGALGLACAAAVVVASMGAPADVAGALALLVGIAVGGGRPGALAAPAPAAMTMVPMLLLPPSAALASSGAGAAALVLVGAGLGAVALGGGAGRVAVAVALGAGALAAVAAWPAALPSLVVDVFDGRGAPVAIVGAAADGTLHARSRRVAVPGGTWVVLATAGLGAAALGLARTRSRAAVALAGVAVLLPAVAVFAVDAAALQADPDALVAAHQPLGAGRGTLSPGVGAWTVLPGLVGTAMALALAFGVLLGPRRGDDARATPPAVPAALVAAVGWCVLGALAMTAGASAWSLAGGQAAVVGWSLATAGLRFADGGPAIERAWSLVTAALLGLLLGAGGVLAW